jgi:hypothetical protein
MHELHERGVAPVVIVVADPGAVMGLVADPVGRLDRALGYRRAVPGDRRSPGTAEGIVRHVTFAAAYPELLRIMRTLSTIEKTGGAGSRMR